MSEANVDLRRAKNAVLLLVATLWTAGWGIRAVVELTDDRTAWAAYSAVMCLAGVSWIVDRLRRVRRTGAARRRGTG